MQMHPVLRPAMQRLIGERVILCVSRLHLGYPSSTLDRDVARCLIRSSKSSTCVLHLPSPDTMASIDEQEAIPFTEILPWYEENGHDPVVVVNTAGVDTAASLLKRLQGNIQWADTALAPQYDVLHKVELFTAELRCESDATVDALVALDPKHVPSVIPFLEPTALESIAAAIELGVAGIRLRAGDIRKLSGITQRGAVSEAITLIDGRVPVIVEGGLADAQDVLLAAQLGADAVLFNSALAEADDPLTLVNSLRRAAEAAWGEAP